MALWRQVCWLWQKVAADGPGGVSAQRFLDSQQYTNRGILRYERVFGSGFVSTGGLGEPVRSARVLCEHPATGVKSH